MAPEPAFGDAWSPLERRAFWDAVGATTLWADRRLDRSGSCGRASVLAGVACHRAALEVSRVRAVTQLVRARSRDTGGGVRAGRAFGTVRRWRSPPRAGTSRAMVSRRWPLR